MTCDCPQVPGAVVVCPHSPDGPVDAVSVVIAGPVATSETELE